MRFLHRAISGFALAAVTLALLAWSAVSLVDSLREAAETPSAATEAAERVFPVRTMTVEPGIHQPVAMLPGQVRARRSLELRARASGVVVEVAQALEEGGRVAAGDLLLRTDPAPAEAALARAEADLYEAQAAVRDADIAAQLAALDLDVAERQATLQEQARRRQQDLQARGVGSISAAEEAELAAAAADQAVVSRRIALAAAETRITEAATQLARSEIAVSDARRALADTEIRAAFAGTLSEVSVVDGGLIAENERFAVLVDPDDLEVAFRVSTAQYVRLLDSAGRLSAAGVRVALDSAGLTIESAARLDRAAATVGEGQTGRLLFARLEGPEGFRAGDLVRVELAEQPLQDVVRLPVRAVSSDGSVLRLGEGGRLEDAPVVVLRRQGDDLLVRATGLEGDEIVGMITPGLGPGVRVEPIAPPQGPAIAEVDPGGPEMMLRLAPDRRARLIAFVQEGAGLTEDARDRALAQLEAEEVPAQMVETLESRMGS